jgi:hypothetical protein
LYEFVEPGEDIQQLSYLMPKYRIFFTSIKSPANSLSDGISSASPTLLSYSQLDGTSQTADLTSTLTSHTTSFTPDVRNAIVWFAINALL